MYILHPTVKVKILCL